MKLVIFEGTPEELQSASSFLNLGTQAVGGVTPKVADATDAAPSTAVEPVALTEDVAKAFLTRRPLPKTQKDVLRVIKKARNAGVTTSELARELGCADDIVKGAMRAFGKRAAHTEGWPKNRKAFKRTWEGKENRYHLLPEVRAVLESGAVPL
ncbi:hypothetical protein [Caballeronia sp. TF1N1]|uniref:hypothetical protein n=1 Tax=Caballeronia sp. TF1N1 TaxID=2878153 RepID=UPI001FD5253E|nr:hypothetical protein [Caballeronia sp. TF1N1]